MVSITKLTYDERMQIYFTRSKKELITYLTERDKHKIGVLPSYLTLNNYNKLTNKQLSELLAERDIYECPNTCKELT